MITFEDDSGEAQTIEISKSVADLLENQNAITQNKSAAAVTTLASLVAEDLECDVVVNSELYQEDIDTPVFTTYKNAIAEYCQ